MSSSAPPTTPFSGNVRPRDRAGRRWAKALGLVALILMACWWTGQHLAEQVRDLNGAELRQRMADEDTFEVEEAIRQVNRLDVRARREVMQSREAQRYFERLKPDARVRFVKETLDRGLQEQIEHYRKMQPEERKAFIEEAKKRQEQAREDLENLPPEERARVREMVRNGNMEEMVERATQQFLRVTTSEERAELAPLYEGALQNLQRARTLPR
ncbi:MAG: hypothetical protein HS116_14550 [Planctomycetes bacterium]|nr:hypothetical protein [Planctomycetota bacterium]